MEIFQKCQVSLAKLGTVPLTKLDALTVYIIFVCKKPRIYRYSIVYITVAVLKLEKYGTRRNFLGHLPAFPFQTCVYFLPTVL